MISETTIFIVLAPYLLISLLLYLIAKKAGSDIAWGAFIPFVNLFVMLDAGGKPYWWIILLFIPIVNVVFTLMTWMAIAERRRKASWLGLLIIIPGVNLVILLYLALSD